jgi:predicted RND superfamily exporter protein
MRELSEQLRERITRLLPTAALAPVNAESLPSLLRTQFEDRAGHLGTVFYTKYRNNVVLSDGKNLLRMAAITDNVDLPDGTRVQTASRATIFAEMIRSMRRDGPLAGVVAFVAVVIVVLIATHNVVGAIAVIFCLIWGACVMLGGSALLGERLNFVNFIAIPITLGIGCEYPFNVYDRSRLLGGDISGAVERAGMAVVLCSYTTVIGYASLLFADSQALQSFGRMAVRGEIACSLAALLVLPAFLYLLSRLRH